MNQKLGNCNDIIIEIITQMEFQPVGHQYLFRKEKL